MFQFSIFNFQLIIRMKALSKQKLADKAGVSLNTFNKWCKPLEKELQAMGLQPGARMWPPHIVKFIAETFCIDIE